MGLVPPLPNSSSGSKATRFSEAAVNALKARIADACTVDRTAGMVPLRKFCERSGQSQISALLDIIDGRLEAATISEDELLDRILVDPKQLSRKGMSYLTLVEAAEILNVRKKTISSLIACGAIPYKTRRFRGQGLATKLILRRDIDSFRVKFMTLAELQTESGIHYNVMKLIMKRRGIAPAFPPSSVNASFITRTDVEKLLAAH